MNDKLIERKCYFCGKTFIPAPYHIYKARTAAGIQKLCSYKCQCEYEKIHKSKKKASYIRGYES